VVKEYEIATYESHLDDVVVKKALDHYKANKSASINNTLINVADYLADSFEGEYHL